MVWRSYIHWDDDGIIYCWSSLRFKLYRIQGHIWNALGYRIIIQMASLKNRTTIKYCYVIYWTVSPWFSCLFSVNINLLLSYRVDALVWSIVVITLSPLLQSTFCLLKINVIKKPLSSQIGSLFKKKFSLVFKISQSLLYKRV